MQIIGSRRRVLLDMATFGILVAFILYFPEPSLKFALTVGQFVPSLASCAFFTYVCHNRKRALLLSAGGAFLGWLLAPTVWVNYEYQNWYDDYAFYYRFWPVYSGIGAFVAGVIAYDGDLALSRSTAHGHKSKITGAVVAAIRAMRRGETKAKPFQFSLATLMVAVTGYAILFGILRSVRVSSPAFIMVTLYFTTVVYSQWAMFGGWHPYAASILTSGSLLVLAFLADLQFDPCILAFVFLIGGLSGISVAGFIDIWLLLSEMMRGIKPKLSTLEWSLLDSPRKREPPERDTPSSSARLAVLFVLASMFFFGMAWGRATGQRWLTATFSGSGRLWEIPLENNDDPAKNLSD